MNFSVCPPATLIVVAPHADDEVLGAGGLILAAADAGWRVAVVFMTACGFVSQTTGEPASTAERRRELEAAAELLGVSERHLFEAGDACHLRLDTLPQSELIGFLERVVTAEKPAMIAIPSPHHFHQDHRAVAAACETALRPAPGNASRAAVPVVLVYGHGGGDWLRTGSRFSPNYFLRIDELIDRKLAALACYSSQVHDPPHGRSPESLRAWHRHWGTYAGSTYAEPFELVRYVC